VLPERAQDKTSEGADRRRCTEEPRVRGHAPECSRVLVMNFAANQTAAPRVDFSGRNTIQQASVRTIEQGLLLRTPQRVELAVERRRSRGLERKPQQHETRVGVHRRGSGFPLQASFTDGCLKGFATTGPLPQTEVPRKSGRMIEELPDHNRARRRLRARRKYFADTSVKTDHARRHLVHGDRRRRDHLRQRRKIEHRIGRRWRGRVVIREPAERLLPYRTSAGADIDARRGKRARRDAFGDDRRCRIKTRIAWCQDAASVPKKPVDEVRFAGMSLLGIDAGGTRTVCVLADETGQAISEVRGPGANLQSAGELDVEKVLHDIIATALNGGPPPAAICLGMAGVDRMRDAEIIRGILHRIGQRAVTVVVNDALIALEAGVPGRPGTVVIAGTGSIAYGRDADGRGARAGGWGYVLGDEGSGYWLGRLALRAVLRAADGRGEQTQLTERVLAHYGVARPRDLVRQIYEGGTRPSAIAALARDVGEAADEGDGIAGHLVSVAAQELAGAAFSVAKRLGTEREPIVLSGGTLLGLGQLQRQLTAELTRRLPDAPILPLGIQPAHGAVFLARAAATSTLRVPAYDDAF